VGLYPSVVAPSRVAERLNRLFPMDRTREYLPLHGGGLPVGMIEHATFADETVVSLLAVERIG
jgi:hypothetical protein